ncbi:hypothetical protein OJ254_29860 [Streptomyces endophytica]|uniref:Uncharacterized protein n=1 Tax=Streptomyces endophytica TaxID=2991496 RepID=A0ABY6PII3_9ACTN|nr:hypothetical protein OJ254_29860 [Streptomyces endophytica]
MPLTSVTGLGTPRARAVPYALTDPEVRERIAESVAEVDESVLARLVDGTPPDAEQLRAALSARTADGSLHPLFFGSALGGQGVRALVDGVVRLIPPAPVAPGGPPRGTVFAVHQPPQGEQTAYLRLFAGELRARQRIELHRAGGGPLTGRITALDVVGRPPGDDGPLTAGNIAVVRGLPGVRTGDRLGPPGDTPDGPATSPPPPWNPWCTPVTRSVPRPCVPRCWRWPTRTRCWRSARRRTARRRCCCTARCRRRS